MTSVHGGSYSETLLTPGKSHRLRLLNVGINNYMHVALDGHKFTVITSDFTPIEPYETDSITIAVGKLPLLRISTVASCTTNMQPFCAKTPSDPPTGQRYDVIIHANNAIGSYWLRVGTGQTCDAPQANEGNIKGIFRYVGALTSDPTSNASVPLPTGCDDETNLVPHSKVNVPSDTPKELEVGFVTTGKY
jgi:FtsP/CotA-like multicopper oxidase with cupredoxin domain